MSSLWKKIEYWDQALFLSIHRSGNSFFDTWFPWIRESPMWAPLYLFIIAFVLYNFRWKGCLWIGMILVAVGLSDLISSQLLKNAFGRLRPCNDPFIQQYIRVIIHRCPKSFSFTSSHAANHFTLAMFIWMTGKRIIKKWLVIFFIWAGLISYAQVYVGVHYPIDIFGGTLIGCAIGYCFGVCFNKRYNLQ